MAKKKARKVVPPKKLFVTVGFIDDEGTMTSEEFEVTQFDGTYVTYMGLELETDHLEEFPNGRITIARTPFKMV